MDMIIKKFLITEKMTSLTDKFNKYGFVVNPKANKIQIKEAVEAMYDVHVVKVNTMNYMGKNKSRSTKGGVISGRTSAFKKAIVTLSEGEIIDFYANI